VSLDNAEVDRIKNDALSAIAGATNLDNLREIRIVHVGDRSPIARLNQGL